MRQIDLEQQLRGLEQRLNRSIDDRTRSLDTRIQTLEAPTTTPVVYTASPNYMPNSHPEWSTMAYETALVTPTTAGDTNRECYNWYRHRFVEVTDVTATSGSATINSASNPFTVARLTGTISFMLFAGAASGGTLTGTLTRVNDGQATMSVNAGANVTAGVLYFGDSLTASATFALKREYIGAQHSLWAANEGANIDIPIWQGVQGNMLLGSETTNYTIDAPLPTDFVYPGQTYYVYLETALATGSTNKGASQQLAIGFWDRTSGQDKWIEGDAFTPTAEVFGSPGSRTVSYKVLAKTDSDTQILSTEVTVTTAPSSMSTANHVRLFFTGAPGFIYYGIYRKVSSTYRLVREIRNSIDLQFFDVDENAGSPQPSFPTLSTSPPKALAVTREFEPLSSTSFLAHTATIKVPPTYNRGNTSSEQQWLRLHLTDLVPSGNTRGIVLRRLMISEGYGAWARSPRDMLAVSSPTSSAANAPGGGNPTGNPHGGGSGGPACVVLDTKVEIISPINHTIERVEIREIEQQKHWTWCGIALPVTAARTGTAQEVIAFETKNGLTLHCTVDHRLIRSAFDRMGKAAQFIQEGEDVLTCIDGHFEQSVIIKAERILGNVEVKTVTLPAPHLFICNGFVCHNRKNLPSAE